MGNAFLILSENSGKRLHFAKDDAERDRITSEHFNYRISPIFPARIGSDTPDLAISPWIGFFTFTSAFQRIAELLESVDPAQDLQIWFGYGLPSVILFSKTREALQKISTDTTSELRSCEFWHIDEQGVVIGDEPWFALPATYDKNRFAINGALVESDPDLSYLAREIAHGIRNIVPLAAQHSPPTLRMLEALTGEVNGLLRKLSDYREQLLGRCAGITDGDALQLRERINSATDHLVQINSVLTYAHSQEFGSVTPLLSNRTYVHGHSLLGLGTAVSALHGFVDSVNSAFQTAPIYTLVRTTFRTAQSFNPFRHLNEVNPEQWARQQTIVDTILKNNAVQPIDARPHILFFSGRLGFQESPYSISAAIQSIEFADSTRWSLTTLSHELMHSHVRMLLDALLSGLGDAASSDSHANLYARYETFVRRGGQPSSLTESIQFALLNYCRFRLISDQASQHEGVQHVKDFLPTVEQLFAALHDYYRDINEIIVHILDFRYFYDSDPELYIDYLWKSWATVPSVLEDPVHYILRCLAVTATTFKGTPPQKFEQAFQFVNARVSELHRDISGAELFARVTAVMESASNKTLLTLHSLANQYLAEVAMHSLYSSAISAHLSRDTLLDVNSDGTHIYQLQAGEFVATPIESPVSLLLDRIRHAANYDRDGEKRSLTHEHRSAWLLMACASSRGA